MVENYPLLSGGEREEASWRGGEAAGHQRERGGGAEGGHWRAEGRAAAWAGGATGMAADSVVLLVLRMIHGHLFPAILHRIAGQSRTRLFTPSMIFSRPG